MKPTLHFLLLIAITAVGALGQTCERTLAIGLSVPGVGAGDFDAMLGRQALTITKVEPIRSSRILILIAADASQLAKGKDEKFEKMAERLGTIDAIPANVSLALGLSYAEKMTFSRGFTSDPQELRKGLQELAKQAKSGAAGTAGAGLQRLGSPLDFFGQPQAGDAVVLLGSNGYSFGFGAAGTLERFLQQSTRLFAVGYQDLNYEEGEEAIPFMSFAEATGGHANALGGDTTFKKEEAAQWRGTRDFLLYGISKGYMVTVAIPAGAGAKQFRWRVKLRDSALRRLGIPGKAKVFLEYPDLLLCSTSGGTPQVATAVRPRF